MKSLRSSGSEQHAAASRRSSSEPPKRCSSVRTDIAAAPPSSYARATSETFEPGRIGPADGELRLCSAIIERPGRASASRKLGRAGLPCSASSLSGIARLRCSRSCRVVAMISSRTLTRRLGGGDEGSSVPAARPSSSAARAASTPSASVAAFACHVDRRASVYEREIAPDRLTGQHGARDRGVLPGDLRPPRRRRWPALRRAPVGLRCKRRPARR